MITLFVLPLDEMVFFPTSTVPLNIFEPRYLEMVADSLAQNIPIALPFVDPQRAPQTADLNLIAGYGDPTVVLKRDDGTQVVQMKGKGKARLRRIIASEKPYLICEAERIEDVADITPPQRFGLNRFKGILSKWLDANVPDEKQRSVIMSNVRSPQAMLECYAMCMVQDPDTRQAFLELDTSDERVRFLQKLSG